MKSRNSQPNLTTTDPLGSVHVAATAVAAFIWLREDAVHDLGAAFDHRPQLLAVAGLGDHGRAMTNQPGDAFYRHSRIRQQGHEAVA